MKQVMYIAINKDLEGLINNPGKIGAHTAHAVFDYINKTLENIENSKDHIDEWTESEMFHDIKTFIKDFKINGDTIIVVKASEKDMFKWENEGYTAVRDRGLTCVEENSLTAINLGIYDKDNDEVPKWIQKLRLL